MRNAVTTTLAPSLTVPLVNGNQNEIADLMIAAIVNAGVNTVSGVQRVEDRTNVYGNATTGRLETAAF